MVFEQIFRASWMEKRPSSSFFIATFYAIIAIVSARLIFPANSGIMSVAFLAVLLGPSLGKLMSDEERIEVKESGKFHIKRLLKDHEDIFEIYFFLFIAVFVVYFVIAMLLPANYVISLFREQLQVLGNITGAAAGEGSTLSILLNNLKVLVVVFLLSFLYGAGAIVLIVWNASTWGAIFGFMFKETVFVQGFGVINGFVLMMLPFVPHIVIEAMSYLAVAISGGVLSKAALREKWRSAGFHHVITDSLIFLGYALALVIMGAYIEVKVVPLFFGG